MKAKLSKAAVSLVLNSQIAPLGAAEVDTTKIEQIIGLKGTLDTK